MPRCKSHASVPRLVKGRLTPQWNGPAVRLATELPSCCGREGSFILLHAPDFATLLSVHALGDRRLVGRVRKGAAETRLAGRRDSDVPESIDTFPISVWWCNDLVGKQAVPVAETRRPVKAFNPQVCLRAQRYAARSTTMRQGGHRSHGVIERLVL